MDKSLQIKLQFNDKLIKIDAHQGEYWMLQFVIGTSQMRLSSMATGIDNGLLFADIFASFFASIADNIIPDFRKKRAYISSLLAKNEVAKDDRYNKKLFLRLKNGIYILNPEIKIYTNNNWLSPLEIYGLSTFINYLKPKEQRFTNVFKKDKD